MNHNRGLFKSVAVYTVKQNELCQRFLITSIVTVHLILLLIVCFVTSAYANRRLLVTSITRVWFDQHTFIRWLSLFLSDLISQTFYFILFFCRCVYPFLIPHVWFDQSSDSVLWFGSDWIYSSVFYYSCLLRSVPCCLN